MEQARIAEFNAELNDEVDWTYAGADTTYMTHGLHSYPARMIPQVANRLIQKFSKKGNQVWDPFCGSGTVLVEAMLLGRESIGTDLNPFAVFLSRVKTTPIGSKTLEKRTSPLLSRIENKPITSPKIPDVKNIEYWFQDYVIQELARIRHHIFSIRDREIRDFFKLCLALTVREASNLRKREFKNVRLKPDDFDKFEPKVLESFKDNVDKCRKQMSSFTDNLEKLEYEVHRPIIKEADNRVADVGNNSVDLIVTSPPYGDHATTVAYGQFSRYPAIWIGLNPQRVRSVDRRGLGGKTLKMEEIGGIENTLLEKIYESVKLGNGKRSQQLLSFFYDLKGSLNAMHKALKSNGKACIVIGNRSMARVRIPTNLILIELSEGLGFKHLDTIHRTIPRKRMPWQNAPENIEGDTNDTMHSENIVILEKVD